MDGDNGEPGLLDEFFEEIRFSLELSDTTPVDMDIDEDEDEDEDEGEVEDLSVDEPLVIASGGLLDDLFEQIHVELEMHHLFSSASSSETDEDECRSLLSDVQFDPSTEIVAVSTRYIKADGASLDAQNISTITAVMVDNDESIENVYDLSPTTPFLVEPQLTTGPLTSDDQQTCVSDLKKSWPLELQKMCPSSEEHLWPSDAVEEMIDVMSAGSDSIEAVSEPMPKKRKSFLFALVRMLLNVGKKCCCCSGGGRRERRATNSSSE